MSSIVEEANFGRIRSFLWPIHRHEFRKFIPMVIMLFCVCFNYSVLRSLKDTLVITSSGAAVIPFIKVWAILPCAVLMTLLFAKMSNIYSQERVFYVMVSSFLVAFALFAFVLHPFCEYLHPVGMVAPLEAMLPEGFKGLIAMCCYWTYTVFYVMCELWGSMVMSVLFWGFANEITRIFEARRFYSVFSIFSNIAAVTAGQASNFFSLGEDYNPHLPFGSNAWEQTVDVIVLVVIASGVVMMLAFRWMNKNVLTDPAFDELHKTKRALKAKKQKMSMKDSFNFLSNSKYLACIAIIVVGYNLTMNLAEVVWKDQLRELYPSQHEFQTYLNNLTSATGLISTIVSLFMAWMIRRLGWTWTASITPFIMLFACSGFFTFMIFKETLSPAAIALTGMTPLVIAVYFGAAQNCLSKAMKYSVFDSTKEMAFIPLDHETKLKGKAAIDGVGSRLGKSGGSLIHQGLLMIFFTLPACAPYLAVIILLAIVGWIFAVQMLGKQFNEIAELKEQEELAQEEQTLSIQEAQPANA